jgi:bifunctional DNase/RNase
MTEILAADGDPTGGVTTPPSDDGDAIGAAVGASMAQDIAAGVAEDTGPPSAYRVMDVEDVSIDLPTQYPQVTLVEAEPPMRNLVFPVGMAEGTAMAQALRRLSAPRPMTHELFINVLQRVHIDVIAVRLTGRENGNYLAELDLMTPTGRERLPCRASDGIVLALRMPVPSPILVDERLLAHSGDVEPQSD